MFDLPRFRRWCLSEEFPERGRIDFLEGEVYVDMSPENLYFHGRVKMALATGLSAAVEEPDLGAVFVDRTRVVSPRVGLSVEPDVVVVLWPTLQAGIIREVEAARAEDGFVELEGAPDLIVEIVSNSSEKKDCERLPELYAKAGVREFWVVDARAGELRFQIGALVPGGYEFQPQEPDGFAHSSVLDAAFRLTRRDSGPLRRPVYKLERRREA